MSPGIWDGCVKIHEGCGGVCRWVEAVDRRGVGYTGECLHCGGQDLPTEQMIPLEPYTHEQVLRVAPCDALASLKWDESGDWDANQHRLRQIVDSVVQRPPAARRA